MAKGCVFVFRKTIMKIKLRIIQRCYKTCRYLVLQCDSKCELFRTSKKVKFYCRMLVLVGGYMGASGTLSGVNYREVGITVAAE